MMNAPVDGSRIAIFVVLAFALLLAFRWATKIAGDFLVRNFYRTTAAFIAFEIIFLAMFWFLCSQAFNAISSGKIHCFGKGCRVIYSAASEPLLYWITFSLWLAAGIFTAWLAIRVARRHVRYQAGEP